MVMVMFAWENQCCEVDRGDNDSTDEVQKSHLPVAKPTRML